jgi:hypothetical protein
MSGQFLCRVNKWTRGLHVCAGLFVGPFVLLFAITAILFNHTWTPWSNSQGRSWERSDIEIPSDLTDLELARAILSQLGITGEIEFFRAEGEKTELIIPVVKPRKKITVRVDVAEKNALVEERDLSLWAALLYLHKSPGPHLAGFRGNWFYTNLWKWFADTSIYLILFASASGVYLWSLLKTKRKAGLIALGVGAATFVSVITFLVR